MHISANIIGKQTEIVMVHVVIIIMHSVLNLPYYSRKVLLPKIICMLNNFNIEFWQ